jgi:hypothetical protein
MTVLVEAVEPTLASSIWERVRGMIDVGYMAGDDLMPTDMLENIRYGKTVLWVAIDDEDGNILAAMTTELVPMRSGLVCWMCQCGGDRMQDWVRFHVKIEEYAKAEGCVKTVLRGRDGWRGVLEGYRVRTVQLEKVLKYD